MAWFNDNKIVLYYPFTEEYVSWDDWEKHVFDVCVMNWLYRISLVMIKGDDDDGYNNITYLDILSL